MKSYSAIAHNYDLLTQNDCDYESWSQYLYEKITESGGEKGVDLACGTGKMTYLLWKKGLNVFGVDSSEEMLAQASRKGNLRFVLQDMTELSLPHKVDFAVCVNDGVNYVAPSKLQPFFKTVFDNLKQNGVFVFDVSSEYKLTNVLANNVFFDDGDDETLLWRNSLQGDKVQMDLTLFSLESGVYHRSDESHVQYVHKVGSVKSALENVGFTAIEITDCYGKCAVNDKSQRITFCACKKV